MARNCTQCGAELRDGIAFCTECGAKTVVPVQSAPAVNTCGSCGAPMKENVAFCTACGARKGENATPQAPPPPKQTPPPPQTPPIAPPVYQAPPPQQTVYQQPAQQPSLEQSVKGTKYEPITTGGFIGIMLLLCIPIIGFILLIVWACGGCRKISKRSFARATLILGIIMVVLGLIISLVFGSLIQSLLKDAGLDTSGLGQDSSWFSSNTNQNQDNPPSDEPLGELGALLEGLEGMAGQENFSGN